MTALALLVIAIIWIAVLVPPFLRNRRESRTTNSIGEFERHLGVLRRAGPPALVDPAHTLKAATPACSSRPLSLRGRDSGPQSPRPPLSPAPSSAPATAGPSRTIPSSPSRQRTLQRRRDVVAALLSSLFGSLLVGVIPSLRMVWAMSGLFGLGLVTYLLLLIRLRSHVAERQSKLAYLPRPVHPGEAALLLGRSITRTG